MLVFVYGTLKKGMGNHTILSKSRFIGNAITLRRSFCMYDNRFFPFVVNADNNDGSFISGELYEVNEETRQRLDTLEGVPFLYNSMEIKVSLLSDHLIAEGDPVKRMKIWKSGIRTCSMYIGQDVENIKRSCTKIKANTSNIQRWE